MGSLITDTSTSAHPVIGVFPSNWGSSRFGREFEPSSERNGDSPIGPMLSVSEYRGVEVRTNFRDGQLPSEDVSHYRVVRPGQLVVNLMWLDHGGLGVSHFPGYVSPAYLAFNISERVHPAFAHHVLRSSVYVDSYKRLGRGVRPNSQMVDSVDLRQLPFPLPPLETQQRIADYLDVETAQIDTTVSTLDELIEEMKSRRVQLIQESVSGSDSYVGSGEFAEINPSSHEGMSANDTNQERTGQCQLDSASTPFSLEPSLFPLVKLHLCARILNGGTPKSNSEYWNGEVPFVTPPDLRDLKGGIVSTVERTLTSAGVESGSNTISKGVIISGRAPVGYVGIVDSPAAFNQGCKGIESEHEHRFLSYVMVASSDNLNALANGTTFLELSTTSLENYRIPLPPLETQQRIADYLDAETAKIDKIVSTATELRSELLARRSALITEVVTGQRKV